MKHFLGGIVLFAVAVCSSTAFGQVDWTNQGPDNSFDNGANWTTPTGTGTVPGPGDSAHIFPGFIATAEGSDIGVTVGGPSTININSSNNHTIDSLLVSSNFDGDTIPNGILNLSFTNGATLTVSSAAVLTGGTTMNFSGNLVVVDGDYSIGTTSSTIDPGQVTGGGTLNLSAGTLTLSGNSTLTVGDGTTGTVNQVSDSTVTFGEVVDLGLNGGTGTFNVNAGNTLNIGSTAQPALGYILGIGNGSGSTGTLTVTNGTLNALNPNTAIYVGFNGSTGTLTQTASSFNLGSTLLDVGAGGTGTYNISGGNTTLGTLVVGMDSATANGVVNQSGGQIVVSDLSNIGGPVAGSSGVYNNNGGSTIFEGGVVVGSTGTINVSGGGLTVSDGSSLDLTASGSAVNVSGNGVLTVGTGGLSGDASGGRLNLGGGTLQTTGNVTDALNGTLSGSTTINAAGTVIFSGTMSGDGSLTVANGTVQASTANLPQIGGVALRTGTTFNLTTSGATTDTFSGTISGTGNLQTGNAGVDNAGGAIAAPAGYTLVIPQTVTLTGGTTTIAGGTGLRAANGTFNTINGGAGSNFAVGGTNGGSVTLLGTATVPNVTVASGSSLAAANIVGNLASNGTLNTLAPQGTLTVSGNLSQPQQGTVAQEGTLVVRTNGATSDLYVANSANLFGSVRVLGVGSNVYNIVQTSAPGQLTTGTLNSHAPDGLAVSNSTDLFTATLSYANGGATLQLTTVQSNLSPFATTPNQRAVGAALDQVIQNPPAVFAPVLLGINSLTPGSVPAALEQLTPESYLYMRDIAFENSTFLAQRVDRFTDNLRSGFSGLDTRGLSVLNPGMESGLGRSLGSLLAYNNEGSAPNGVNYYPEDDSSMMAEPGPSQAPGTISDTSDPRMAPTVAPPPSTSVFDGSGTGFNEFISGDVVLADLNQNNSGSSQPKAHYTAGNATAGVSFRINSNLAAGVLFDYNHTDARTSPQGSHVRVDSYSPGLFATFFEKGFYANGLFTFGYNNYSNNRNIDFGGAGASAHSSPDGQQYSGNLDFGYDFHPDKHWVVGPTLGVQYTHLDVDSFQESGAGPLDLRVDDQSADSVRARIGGRVVYLVRSGPILFQPNFTASFQHEFLNDPFHLDSQLDIPGTPTFATQGSNSGRDTGLIGFGLTATLDNSMNLYLDYLAEIGGDDYFVQSVEGGVKASF